MKDSIAEEGKAQLLVDGDSLVNTVIARHYGECSDEFEVRSVRCRSGKRLRHMWLVDTKLLQKLLDMEPKLKFDVYRRVDDGFANKVNPFYAMRGNAGGDKKPPQNVPKEFPKEDGLTP